jgi:hypothetical protein
MDVASADKLDICPASLEQDSGFAGALPAPDDGDTLAGKRLVAGMLARMADQFAWHSLEDGGYHLLVHQAGGNDDAPRADGIAIGKTETKPAVSRFNAADHARIQIRNRLRLDPQSIVDEVFEQQRFVRRDAKAFRIGVKRQRTLGVADIGRVPG